MAEQLQSRWTSRLCWGRRANSQSQGMGMRRPSGVPHPLPSWSTGNSTTPAWLEASQSSPYWSIPNAVALATVPTTASHLLLQRMPLDSGYKCWKPHAKVVRSVCQSLEGVTQSVFTPSWSASMERRRLCLSSHKSLAALSTTCSSGRRHSTP